MISLRLRLVIVIVALMAGGLGVAQFAGVVLLRSYLVERVDQQLSVSFGGESGVPPGVPSDPCTLADTVQVPTSFVLVVFDEAGAERCRLPGPATPDAPPLQSFSLIHLREAAADKRIETVGARSARGPWRVRTLLQNDSYVVLAVSLADARATVGRLELVAAGVSLGVLALAAAAGLVLVRVGLRPLTNIEQTAEAIAGGDLSRRVPPAPVTTEVGRLAASLNAMLTQIEQAFADRAATENRLRQFVADASHELRTPLATIRGHAELYRQGVATSRDQVAALLGRIESESIRMGALVDDLMLLARLDAQPRLNLRPVDLLSLAAEAVVDARARDPGRAIVLRRPIEPPWQDEPPVVAGDEARLQQVLLNLLSNALRHTPAGAPVEVDVGRLTATVEVRVVDHGPGLSVEGAERVFERFYRGDPGRARDTGGTGLGLAIVASLLQAHHGTIRHEPTPGGGATFVASLPVVSATGGQ